ncbi:MAG TPA: hypothetical protein DCR43_00075 [Bacteroidales bacterium]|nr:MAG: hypothetical protein A2X11_04610 [Bacteroidetes bacterium GWE2_42_24]OFY27690.1 MAG: hypothetical protein A2X09_10850 [Bacteroidetes bacterium GWF2_43_11]HAQ64249.1 hypothetical protein [Bacteroidales bacterium]HBZ66540.1 hypothetical protein [Bacteroidales bacterium]
MPQLDQSHTKVRANSNISYETLMVVVTFWYLIYEGSMIMCDFRHEICKWYLIVCCNPVMDGKKRSKFSKEYSHGFHFMKLCNKLICRQCVMWFTIESKLAEKLNQEGRITVG